MPIDLRRVHPLFGAEVIGAQICEPLDDDTFSAIRDAFEEHSVLVFRGQRLSDAGQIAFSERFGKLEISVKGNAAAGSVFARQSNLDVATGEPIPPEDRRLAYIRVTRHWHTDSSYKPTPAHCSLLSGHIVPPEGANTEFSTCRAAYDDLSPAMKERLEGLTAAHSHMHTLALVDPTLITSEMRDEYDPARHPLVRINPVNGRRALYAGAHAFGVMGLPPEVGGPLLKELYDHMTQPKYVYSHKWQTGDIVMWDNRAVMHRSTPFDTTKYKRLLQRTTVAGNEQEYRAERSRFDR